MIEWDEYIEKLLSRSGGLDSVMLSFDGGRATVPVPPIVKASILMLDKIIENQGKRQIIVFPERQQTAFVFLLARAIHNIYVGEIQKDYDPEGFNPGEKLKVGNAIVEYLGIENRDGKQNFMLKTSDMKFKAPINILPIFQKIDTKKPLSKWEKFASEKKKISRLSKSKEEEKDQISTLLEYKTHMVNSIYYVSSVASVKEQMLSLRICNEKASNLLLMGQTNYEGKITNISDGQLAGIPAIVLSSDIYAVNSSLELGNPAQSVIVEISNINSILSQLDALDELLQKKIPVIFITDTVNSFDFSEFAIRGFNTWRWDVGSLSEKLYDVDKTIADMRIGHCARQKLQFVKVDGNEISESAKLLAKLRKESQEYSPQMLKL